MNKLEAINTAIARLLDATMLLEAVWNGLEGDVSDRFLIEAIEDSRKAGLNLVEYKKVIR